MTIVIGIIAIIIILGLGVFSIVAIGTPTDAFGWVCAGLLALVTILSVIACVLVMTGNLGGDVDSTAGAVSSIASSTNTIVSIL